MQPVSHICGLAALGPTGPYVDIKSLEVKLSPTGLRGPISTGWCLYRIERDSNPDSERNIERPQLEPGLLNLSLKSTG